MSDCKYSVEINKEMMFDFFALLSAVQTYASYKDINPRSEIKEDDKISDAYYRLLQVSKRHDDGLHMFFVQKQERGMNLFEWIFRVDADKYTSSEDLVGAIEKWDPMKVAYAAMKFNDPYNNFQDKFYQEVVNSRDLFMNYMNGLNASTEIRWEIMSFIQRPTEVMESLKEYVKIMYAEFAKEYAALSEKVEMLNTLLNKCIDDQSLDAAVVENEITENEISSKIDILSQNITPPTKEVKIVGLLFAPNQLMKINASSGLYYAVGIGYMDYYNSYMSGTLEELNLRELFRGFTDGTRSQIVEILREKECYNGELSRMLDVPMSSLTHHMEILNRSGFVIKRNVGKRTYYKLNRKQFLNAARLLRQYVEDYDL